MTVFFSSGDMMSDLFYILTTGYVIEGLQMLSWIVVLLPIVVYAVVQRKLFRRVFMATWAPVRRTVPFREYPNWWLSFDTAIMQCVFGAPLAVVFVCYCVVFTTFSLFAVNFKLLVFGPVLFGTERFYGKDASTEEIQRMVMLSKESAHVTEIFLETLPQLCFATLNDIEHSKLVHDKFSPSTQWIVTISFSTLFFLRTAWTPFCKVTGFYERADLKAGRKPDPHPSSISLPGLTKVKRRLERRDTEMVTFFSKMLQNTAEHSVAEGADDTINHITDNPLFGHIDSA